MLTQGSKNVRDGVSRTWNLMTAGGTLAAAVALSGIGFADDRKPEPAREVEVELLLIEDAKAKPAERRDGDRKHAEERDGDRKPEMMKFDVRVAGSDKVKELTKAVNAALEKGDVKAAKEAMAKLQKVLAQQQPHMMYFNGPATMQWSPHAPDAAHATPAGPGGPVYGMARIAGAPGAPGVHGEHGRGVAGVAGAPGAPGLPGGVRVRMVRIDEDVKKMEEKLASLAKAMEAVKDSPEAREALERTVIEFKKKIAESRERGDRGERGEPRWVEAPRAPNAPQPPQPPRFQGSFAPLQLQEMQAHAAEAKAKHEAMVKLLEAKLKAAKSDEVRAKLEAELAQARDLAKEKMHLFRFDEKMLLGDANPYALRGGTLTLVDRAGEGRLGITIDAVPEVLNDQFDLPKGQGVLITGVRDGSAAAKAGIRANDVLLAVAGKPTAVDSVVKIVGAMKPNETFDVVVLRKGKKETIKGVQIPAPKKVLLREASDSDHNHDHMQWNKQNVSVNDGEFKIFAENKEMSITIVGTLDDGKPVVAKVYGTRDGKEFSAKDVTSLSKSDRAVVESLLKNVGGGKTR